VHSPYSRGFPHVIHRLWISCAFFRYERENRPQGPSVGRGNACSVLPANPPLRLWMTCRKASVHTVAQAPPAELYAERSRALRRTGVALPTEGDIRAQD